MAEEARREEFSKLLTENDIQDRLTVPARWMNILRQLFRIGENKAVIKAICWPGFYWEFCCIIRQIGQHEKFNLQRLEWKPFVNFMDLQIGDKFILQSEEDLQRGTNYSIKTERMDAGGLWANVHPPARDAPAYHQFKI